MSVGNLAGALAHAMRRKQDQEASNQQQWNQTLAQRAVNQQRGEDRQYGRDRDAAGDARQREQDAAAAQRAELQRRVIEQQLLEAQQPRPASPPPSRNTDRGIEEFRNGAWEPTGRTPYRAPSAASTPDGTDAKAITREDARRRALITNANSLIREQPKNIVTGGPIDMAKVGEIGAVRDSLSSEIGAPAPDERLNPLARFTAPPTRAGHMEGPPIGIGGKAATPPAPVTPAMDPEELAAAREAVQGRDPATATALLTEAGFSPAEIQAILGGGD